MQVQSLQQPRRGGGGGGGEGACSKGIVHDVYTVIKMFFLLLFCLLFPTAIGKVFLSLAGKILAIQSMDVLVT